MEIGKIVMPGDVLLDISSVQDKSENIIFGPGMKREDNKIIAIKCGILKKNSSKVYYIDNHQNRYVPCRGENVIGIVLKKGTDEAVVDIGSSEPAIADLLSFEGATKRNKPALKIFLPNSPILKRLGITIPYEIAIGVNGRIWVKSTTIEKTLVLVQALSVLEYATSTEIELMCDHFSTIHVS
ncbi:exosome complex component RRP40 [Caerostris extrusa]|uniref:Exosome complex component RRP40 n=1 Tax=Caerostris extrusa TaxID=172846 RepID=A0AAV4WBE9_CAEEX|nr:exosome complex component RRP40 [Caerostris extrusa]